MVVLGGVFDQAGDFPDARVVGWNGEHWQVLASAETAQLFSVNALAVLPDGSLVVGGRFSAIAGVAASNIARFDGASWSPLGGGVAGSASSIVRSIAVLPTGGLIATGSFTTAGGTPAANIAMWDGFVWRPLGSGLSTGGSAVTVLPDGHVVVGGPFSIAGGAPAQRIARWTGTAWLAFGSGVSAANPASANVAALAVSPDGQLVVGGSFESVNGVAARSLARWNPATDTWHAYGAGVSGSVAHVLALAGGDLIVTGSFAAAGGDLSQNIAEYRSGVWSRLGSGLSASGSTAAFLPSGDLIVGGFFTRAGHAPCGRVAVWQPALRTWAPLQVGNGGPVASLLTLSTGEVVAGGYFRVIGGQPATGVAAWNGAVWSPLGAGPSVADGFPAVKALVEGPNGDLFAGGGATEASGPPPAFVSLWTGGTWITLGEIASVSAVSGYDVTALVGTPEGAIIAGGNFKRINDTPVNSIARWSGSAWSPLGGGITGSLESVRSLWMSPIQPGHVIAGGRFTNAGGRAVVNLAQWDGTQWSTVGQFGGTSSAGAVYAMADLPTGELVVAGSFTTIGGVASKGIARWAGSRWSALGGGIVGSSVDALAVAPSGTLYAGGSFSSIGGVAANNVARWDGTAWHPMGSGTDKPVAAIAVLRSGEVMVGGDLRTAGGATSTYWAVWTDRPEPHVAIQPRSRQVQLGGVIELRAMPSRGRESVSYQWLRNGHPVVDGSGGASPGGGTVSGAAGLLESPTAGRYASLLISSVQSSDAGAYRIRFLNPCGGSLSEEATLTVVGPCAADFNAVDSITVQDLFDYLAAYHAGEPRAEFDGVDGVTIDDVFAFLAAFFAGCP